MADSLDSNNSVSYSVKAFLGNNSEWITSDHLPLVAALKMAAASLDKEFSLNGKASSGSLTAYRQLLGQLVGSKPAEGSEGDSDDDLFGVAE